MERVKLTAENAANAETYLPLAVKSSLATILAPGCMEKTQSGRWQERIIGRKLVEAYVLAGHYLHLIDTSGLEEKEPRFDFTLEQYDSLSRLEEDLPNEWEIKGGEIMADFARFKEILDLEIGNTLAERNDPLNRLNEAIEKGLTPEILNSLRDATQDGEGK